jgi:hypothetical protein
MPLRGGPVELELLDSTADLVVIEPQQVRGARLVSPAALQRLYDEREICRVPGSFFTDRFLLMATAAGHLHSPDHRKGGEQVSIAPIPSHLTDGNAAIRACGG